MQQPTSRTIKGYQLEDLIGEGAYGAVYRARQQAVDRQVAVKIILPEFANRPDFIRRFETEAQLVAQLEHIHIVPLYDYWRDPEGAFLVMRLMKGGSLTESMERGASWNPEQIAHLVDQIASALEAAHQQGIVHRDLKPANILLDEDGNAYLSDFGIAKELASKSEATTTGAILGTPAYLTPEQVQSLPVTPQTDIYALGVLLYELLVGEHPYPDSSTGELVSKHLNEPLPYVRDTHPDLPAALDGIIQRATAKNPADRYPTAISLAEDFRRALELQVEPTKISETELYNPYKGLRAFQEADSEDFFGRDALTGQLLAHLAAPGEGGRFLAVVGPSGSGKSSVVKAGLLPALRRGALPGSDQWFIVEMHPGSQPFKEMELALLGISTDFSVDLGALLRKDNHGITHAVRAALPGEDSQLLIVIDQFEELFITVQDEARRSQFLDSLQQAVTYPGGQVRIMLTLRADFYDRPLMYPHFGQLVEEHTAIVLPLASEELEQAIRDPAERVGAVLEKGLVSTITADVADQPGTLPLLQYAMTELFERREGPMLTNQAYQEIGGVLGALGRRAEGVYADLEPQDKEIARQLFLRLVTLGEGTEDTRRRVPRTDLESLFSERKTITNQVIDTFGKARLLSFDRDPTTRGATVEVAHEALLREWPRLHEWLDESRADIRMQVLLSSATHDWLEGDQEASFLLRGSRLAQFEEWVQETSLVLTADEQRFLQASLADQARRKAQQAALERRSRNFLRALVAVFAVAAIVAIGLTIFAFNQQGIAQDNAATAVAEADARATQQVIAESEAMHRATQQAIAESETVARGEAEQQALNERDRAVEAENEALVQASIGLAGQALNEMDGPSPERAVPLALEALEKYPYTWQAHRALGQAVMQYRLDMVFSHDDVLNSMELSQDGERLLTGSDDGTVRVWDPSNGNELLRLTEGDPTVAKWSPDESTILTYGENDFAIQLWDSETGSLIFSQEVDYELSNRPFNWFPWSPESDRFVTSQNDQVIVWDATTGTVLSTLSGHKDFVGEASWSPAGNFIVTTSDDNSAILWDAKTGHALNTLPGTDWGVRFGSWSPSGDRFALRGLDRASVYETSTGEEILTISLPGYWINFTRFSPDGTQLITTILHDGTARLWDIETGELLSIISGLSQGVGISWTANGELACIVGVDGSVRVWDLTTGLELQSLPFFGATSCEWSISEDRVYAAGSESNDIKVFELSAASLTIPGTPGIVTGPDWSPDGQQIGRAFPYGDVQIWDADTGEEIMTLDSGGGEMNGLVWSHSGDRILTWNEDNTTKVWDSFNGELLFEFTGHEGGVFYGEWSPDGSRIATGDMDSTPKVIVWDSKSGEELWHITLPEAVVGFATWSPDGSRIVTTGGKGEASIRDAETGEMILDLYPGDYTPWTEGSAWSHDGNRIIIFGLGIGRIFDTKSGEEIISLSSEYTGSVWRINWSPSDNLIYTLGGDGTYRIFDVATGAELLAHEIGGWPDGSLSPDGTRMAIGSNDGPTSIYPTWNSSEELIAYAKECCLLRELTPEERQQFGMPPNE